MMMRVILILLFPCVCFASAVPTFHDMTQCENAVFLLTTPKSGSNLVSGSLLGITRKPISWIIWGYGVLDPHSHRKSHPSYNRLGVPLVSDLPLLYRTHYEYATLKQVPKEKNKLIFVTRNPKELLFREFFQKANLTDTPTQQFIDQFLAKYLPAWEIFDSWGQETRFVVFYEDFIYHDEAILLQLLEFMNEEPVFLDDFLEHKQEYLQRLLDSYRTQHVHNSGGASSRGGPKPIYYTRDVPLDVLGAIDQRIEELAPRIWQNYLKRFQTLKE